MEEIWKDIPGYEGFYEASTLGRIRSYPRSRIMPNGGIRIYPARYKTPYVGKQGYVRIKLHKEKQEEPKSAHLFIARTFMPNPLGYKQLNHIDGDKTNNAVSNLEWVSCRENNTHRCLRGKKTSQYVGVDCIGCGKWRSQIVINKKKVFLGKFSTEEAAGAAYQKALFEQKEVNRYAIAG